MSGKGQDSLTSAVPMSTECRVLVISPTGASYSGKGFSFRIDLST